MAKRSEGFFKGYDDIELFYQTWASDNPAGTLVITHGLGEHSESYIRLADGLKHTPWEVYAWDLRGHGRSEGKRGVVKSFSEYYRDLHCFLELVKEKNADRPTVLLGHSLGGLINIRGIQELENLTLKAAVLSSPLLGVAVKVPKYKKVAAEYLAKYLPNFTLYNEISHKNLTSDKKVIEEFERDPLRHDRISATLYLEMLDNCEKAMQKSSKIWLPVLVQQAGEDRVVSRPATERFVESLGSATKDLIVYDGYMHEIYNESGREKVYEDLKAWLSKFL